MNNKKDTKTNYKGEVFLATGPKLLTQLEAIASELESNMKHPKSRFKVSEILSIRTNSFQKFWPDIAPLNPDHKHSKKEYKGLYAFARIEKGKVLWQYIGISQTIKRRFKGHTIRRTKNSASWAYLIRKSEEQIPTVQKRYIHPCYFTFVQVEDNMLLHMAEVYCVNKFRSEYNSFETH